MKVVPVVVVVVLSFVVQVASDPEQCGAGAADAVCGNNLCCSKWGFCGSGDPYCGDGCQSGPCNTPPPSPPAPGGLGEILSESAFNEWFSYRNKFYNYQSFIEAAKSFPEFAATGDEHQRKQEVAAFCTHVFLTSVALILVTDLNESTLCEPNSTYCCAEGKKYFGRGPLQLSWNYNYGAASPSVGSDILCNPDKVAEDPVLAFKTAIWFWTTPQYPKPSCHDVMVGRWSPNAGDVGRKPGFGETINIINGLNECGPRWDESGNDRVDLYEYLCLFLNVSPGENLECKDATPYGVNITAIEGSFDFPCCKRGFSASHRAESWQQI